jgi:hypothetical protein
MEHVSETITTLFETWNQNINFDLAPKLIATPVEQQRAIEAIQNLIGPASRLKFQTREQETLSDGEPLIFDIYVDGKGNEY